MTTTEPTTEVVLRDGSSSLVPVSFTESFPALAPDETTLELLESNLGETGELTVSNLKRLTVPSGEVDDWMVPNKGKKVATEHIDGILMVWKPRRSYWVKEGEVDGSAPDCFSLNNRTPVSGGLYAPDGPRGAQNPKGLCSECPMSKRGSSARGGMGSGCREQRVLFMIQEGKLFPIVINGPRTSIAPLLAYMMDLVDEGVKYHMVVMRLGLKKAKNAKGIIYNVIDPSVLRNLTPEEVRAVEAYKPQIESMVNAAMSDFTPPSDDEGGISVGDEEE